MLNGRECNRCAGRVLKSDAVWYRDYQASRHIDELAREPVDVKAHDALDVFAKVVAALATGLACAAGEGTIHDDAIADLEGINPRPERGDLTGRLDTDDQRKFLPAGERHPAVAPQIQVIEADRPHAHLHLAGGRWWRIRQHDEFELAVGDESKRSHTRMICGQLVGGFSAGCLSPRKARRQWAAPRR